MNKPERCKIEYLGFSEPKSPNELRIEVAGLEHLISKATERILGLKQSMLIADLFIAERNSTERKND